MLERFFKFKENGTNLRTEIIAGLTTFFAMSYIIFVNPAILSLAGTEDNPIPTGAVFLATIIASMIGTLIMGLFANVPYAQAPGMGLNAFFTFTVCGSLGYTWQQALAMVFICGMINVVITVTKVRKLIIKSIPESLQHAIGGGIGVFIAYIGIKNSGFLQFTSDPGKYAQFDSGTVVADSSIVPALVTNFDKGFILALIGLVMIVILLVLNVKGGVIITIIATTAIGAIMGVVDLTKIGTTADLGNAFTELGQTFGVAFGEKGMLSLFSDPTRIPSVLMTIFAFSLSDTFDTIGTFIGTGRRSGIFSDADLQATETGSGFKSKMDKALFADSVATSIGAILGTSNTTTYVESATGIGAGGRTGFTSVITAAMFGLSIFLAPVIGIVPTQATAPVLIAVGVMMLASFKEIDWADISEAIPAFFASIFMGLCYNISYGIAAGFIFFCITKVVKGKAREVSPILWVMTGLFLLNFIVLGIL